ncbi:MAG: LysE family translocator [Acidobacteriota bacterium]
MPAILVFLIKGIIVGIVIAVPVGPVGVLCVRRSFFEGAHFGVASGLGAALADMIFGIIAGLGLTVVRDAILGYQEVLGTAGGIYLLFAGTRALMRQSEAERQPLTGEKLAAAFASTFALTITNPITILAFAAIFAKVGFDSEGVSFINVGVMVGGVFAGSLFWWLSLSFGIAALRRFAGMVHLTWVDRVSGAVLVLSGGGLIGSVALDLVGIHV